MKKYEFENTKIDIEEVNDNKKRKPHVINNLSDYSEKIINNKIRYIFWINILILCILLFYPYILSSKFRELFLSYGPQDI